MIRSAPKWCQLGYGQAVPISRNQRIEAATRLADIVARLVVLAKSLLGGLRGSWVCVVLVKSLLENLRASWICCAARGLVAFRDFDMGYPTFSSHVIPIDSS